MRKLFHNFFGFIIRISAFVGKEFFSVISQPRLLAVLILGPFLILFVFGVSYQSSYRTLRTMVVLPEDSRIEQPVQAFAELPLSGLQVVELTHDRVAALRALKSRQIELVMDIPADTVEKIESNQPAEFSFYHREIDPMEVTYVEFVAAGVVEEVNRQLLLAMVGQSKDAAREYQGELRAVAAVEDQSLDPQPEGTALAAGADSLDPTGALWFLLRAARGNSSPLNGENPAALGESAPQPDGQQTAEENDLQTLDAQLTRFVEMDSGVIVEPVRRKTFSLSEIDIQPVHFYIPAVLALLLQHIAISLSGLSIVSERFVGTMELMRASPANAFEVLLGKYLSFLVILGVLAAALTALVHWGLGAPMMGSWLQYAAAVILVILVSLGIGFLISNFSRSDSQAIQFSMVLLLGSIFFSGFFLQLYRLRWPAQVISWMLPSTYGLLMLQDIMLRGMRPLSWLFWVLGGMAAVLFAINWLRLRALMMQD